MATSVEAALGAVLQKAADAIEAYVADTEQACILVHWMLREMADIGLQATRWNPAKVSHYIHFQVHLFTLHLKDSEHGGCI